MIAGELAAILAAIPPNTEIVIDRGAGRGHTKLADAERGRVVPVGSPTDPGLPVLILHPTNPS